MKKIITLLFVVVLALAIAVPASAATYSVSGAPSIKLDGVISEDEWGTPIFKGVTKAAALDGSVDSIVNYWEFDATYASPETFDLYVNNDSENIYLGLVVHDTAIDANSAGANLWQYQNFTFTIATAMGSGVPAIDFEGQNYEQYTGFRIGMIHNGAVVQEVLTQGIDAVKLTEDQYRVVYDEAAKTMTYEVAVPYSLTNIDLANSTSMALSAVIPLQFSSNSASGATDGANRFLIGTAAAFCGGPANYAHNGQTIVVTLNDVSAVEGIVPEIEELPETEVPEEGATDAPADAEVPAAGENVTVEVIERELVWKTSTQMIIIYASGAVVLLSIIVIILSFVKKKPKAVKEESEATEPSDTTEA